MATGRLGAANLNTGTNTTVYTTPASTYSVVTDSMCNSDNSACAVRFAVAAADVPLDSEWVEYDTEVLSKGGLERTGLVLDAGKKIVAWTSTGNMSVVVMGIETAV